jgi:lipid II:glycine glycyltransferase (peptidoglycan interpeptide bridge formation enzyme)
MAVKHTRRVVVRDSLDNTAQSEVALRWDRFVGATSGGEHIQSHRWALLKSTEGWKAITIEVIDDETILGGAQMLVRSVPVLGAVGYVPKGPVFRAESVAREVLDRIETVAAEEGVRHLTVQPASGGEMVGAILAERGYSASPAPVAPNATLIIDLDVAEEVLLAAMARRTRYNVRLGERRGLTCRVAGEADLPTYHAMLAATAERQGFSPHSIGYLEAMWAAFAPGGHLELLFVEREGEALAGMLGIGFGDTFTNKLSVWSGEFGSDRPNETLQWCAIRRAKDAGYRYYDFEGISLAGALALEAGESLPDDLRDTVTSFKLGFGGVPVITPHAWYRVSNPVVGWAYGLLVQNERGARLAKTVSNRIRTGRRL